MSALSDDRETVADLRSVLSFLAARRDTLVTADAISRGTGTSMARVEHVLGALSAGAVIDFADDPPRCTYRPSTATDLEVARFLRVADAQSARLQRSVDRFRGQYGGR